jgi:hypothetical protein
VAYFVEKPDYVDLWTEILPASTDQNGRYRTIVERSDVWDLLKMLLFDFFNTIGR